ncbi:hypothetical protein QAD02_012818 [Eretmocerus hayati]|uniref:Uncharacterized protein n=1 Tax=Eretmocerus hayati TaxID=131215 RepID=A0ACC2P0T6_9HYME|nr:hypothetical protein QAD02_012818 [Eretmocerus hayati]
MNAACAVSRMIAKLRSNSTFTVANIDRISEAANAYTRKIAILITEKFQRFLIENRIDPEDIGFDQFFQSLELREPFQNLNGIDKQVKNMQLYCTFNGPSEFHLGTRLEHRFNRKTKEYEQREEVRGSINSERCSPGDLLENTRDGRSFHSNPFSATYPQALKIILYNDDLVVNDTLGTKTHPHKLGAFYFKIDNLPHYLNEFLGGIHVPTLYYTADKNKYGVEKILKPFLNDLDRLESDDGILIDVDGRDYILRASIMEVSADTSAAHELLGFLGPSARHFCRSCMISRDQLKAGTARNLQRRTRELHQRHLKLIRNDANNSTETGVNSDSPLHRSRYFHARENHLFDIMHDDLQGIGQLILKLAILHFTTTIEYDFTVDLLNSRIDQFRYGSTEIKNKPSGIFQETALRNLSDHIAPQKAMQTWCLLRVLPFLFSVKVPLEDEHLQTFSLLNRINEIIFSMKLHGSVLPYLSLLIKELIGNFYVLHSHRVRAINKLHHFDHFVECIEKSGPLRPLCCLTFEQKHGPFKKYASICCNFKNIPKTLMKMNQINQAAIWGTNEPPREKIEAKVGRLTRVRNTLSKILLVSYLQYRDERVLYKCDNIRVYGMQYTLNLVVASKRAPEPDCSPIFGTMTEIVANDNDEVFLLCKNFTTVSFEESLNSYRVSEGSEYSLIRTDNLIDRRPYNL